MSGRCDSCGLAWVDADGDECPGCSRRHRTSQIPGRVKPWMHLEVGKAVAGNPASASVLRPVAENRPDERRVVDVRELALVAATEFRLGPEHTDDLVRLAYTVATELGRTPVTPSGEPTR